MYDALNSVMSTFTAEISSIHLKTHSLHQEFFAKGLSQICE